MTRTRLILRTMAHYWRTNLGVVIGVMIASAVLTGALITGDSIRHTLRSQAEARIGQVDVAMITGDRFFIADLAERVEQAMPGTQCAAAIYVRGIVTTPNGARTARDVNLLGVDEQFFKLAPQPLNLPLNGGKWVINDRLADAMAAQPGDELIIRMEKPSALPRESVLADSQDYSFSARGEVQSVLGTGGFGHFGLTVSPLPPQNIFVPIDWLHDQLEIDGRANTLLVRTAGTYSVKQVNEAIDDVFTLADAQCRVVALPGDGMVELNADRIFLDPPIADLVTAHHPRATGLLTYFVNTLAANERETPYSMITAIGAAAAGDDRETSLSTSVLPPGMADDEIVINDWLAEDLAASPGDALRIAYFVLDDDDRLVERERTFTVRSVIPMEGLAADRSLMPEFPGIANAESSRDWQPGMPIDLGRVRDKDETYWQDHRGTPKAFITLAAGQEMWANRYGNLTAMRMEVKSTDVLREQISRDLNPAALGFHARDVRTAALAASNPATDFGMLLLGLSSFLIGASLVLTALLFVLTAQQRATQIGVQRAIGFTVHDARCLLLLEAAALAIIGCIIGGLLSIGYTAAILAALGGIWSDAVAGTALSLHITPVSLAIGMGASFAIAWISMRMAIGRMLRRDALSLLRDDPSAHIDTQRTPRISIVIAITSLLASVVIIATAGGAGPNASRFFGAGALALVAGIALCRIVLVRLSRAGQSAARLSVISLGVRNNARRIGRGLAVTWMLASGVFLVGSISVHQLDAWQDADARDSGTGGFAFVGETSISIPADLNTTRGREVFGFTHNDLAGASFVSMRVRAGDEASCLNLNRPQTPRLLGVDPDQLAERGAFRFARWDRELMDTPSWALLDHPLGDGRVPVIVDDTSAMWSLHKSIGDAITYTSESGEAFDAVIVGTIGASILQGNVLMSEENFRSLFPTSAGFGMFLIDAPADAAEREALAARIERAMSDVGMQVQPAAERLAEFNAVQNTYLAVFQVLGGLGLLLGVAGLGVFVVRNVIERRGEIALLRAVGFSNKAARRLLVSEHLFLLFLGLLVGTLAAAIALIPIAESGTTRMPTGLILAILIGLVANGAFWVVLAARWALRGDLLRSLQRDA